MPPLPSPLDVVLESRPALDPTTGDLDRIAELFGFNRAPGEFEVFAVADRLAGGLRVAFDRVPEFLGDHDVAFANRCRTGSVLGSPDLTPVFAQRGRDRALSRGGTEIAVTAHHRRELPSRKGVL